MSENSNNYSEQISLISFILVITSVLYSPDNYDIWDILFSGTILYALYIFRKKIIEYSHSLIIFEIGFSICLCVLLMSLFALFFQEPSVYISSENETYDRILKFFDLEFIISFIIFVLIYFTPKRYLI